MKHITWRSRSLNKFKEYKILNISWTSTVVHSNTSSSRLYRLYLSREEKSDNHRVDFGVTGVHWQYVTKYISIFFKESALRYQNLQNTKCRMYSRLARRRPHGLDQTTSTMWMPVQTVQTTGIFATLSLPLDSLAVCSTAPMSRAIIQPQNIIPKQQNSLTFTLRNFKMKETKYNDWWVILCRSTLLHIICLFLVSY
jgi:hypothetical protein